MATVEEFRECLNKDIVGRESLKEKLIEQSPGLRIVLLLLPKYRLRGLPGLVDIVFVACQRAVLSKPGSQAMSLTAHCSRRCHLSQYHDQYGKPTIMFTLRMKWQIQVGIQKEACSVSRRHPYKAVCRSMVTCFLRGAAM